MSTALDSIDRPVILAFGGQAGAGKTTVARAIAPFLGPLMSAVWLNTMEMRCARAELRSDQPSDADEPYIRNEEKFDDIAESEQYWHAIDSSGSVNVTLGLVFESIYWLISGGDASPNTS